MKYLMTIYDDPSVWGPGEREVCYSESTQYAKELFAQGKLLGVNPLQPVTTAKSVKVREGKSIVTDGPFAETREQLGGYFLVEAADMDEALRIAEKIPGGRKGTVEVRPVLEIGPLPV